MEGWQRTRAHSPGTQGCQSLQESAPVSMPRKARCRCYCAVTGSVSRLFPKFVLAQSSPCPGHAASNKQQCLGSRHLHSSFQHHNKVSEPLVPGRIRTWEPVACLGCHTAAVRAEAGRAHGSPNCKEAAGQHHCGRHYCSGLHDKIQGAFSELLEADGG